MTHPPARWSVFFAELRRRHVIRVGAMYAVASWVVIEVTSTTIPLLYLPEWWATLVVVLAIAGFPVTLLLAWLFDLTPAGIRRTEAAGSSAAPMPQITLREVILFLIPVLLLSAGVWGVGEMVRPAPAAVVADTKSVAVLPFANLSAEPENAFFASGIHDEVLSQLAKVADLRVISRTSVLGYAGTTKRVSQIGEELGVSTVMEGSVQRDGSRVRVSVQLINAGTDEQIWSETFDRELTDVFAIQTDIAERIVEALKVNLTASERAQLARVPTWNAEAYTFFLQARDYYRRPDADPVNLQNAVHLFEEAIRLDPEFALAYASLADAHGSLYWFGFDPTPERLRLQMVAAEQAHRIAPDLPESHEAIGMYHYRARNYEAALSEFEIARRAAPNQPYLLARMGYVYRRQGRWQEAVAHLEQAARLNPRDADLQRDLAQTYHADGRYSAADAAYRRSLALAPDYFRSSIRRGQLFVDWRATTDTLEAALAAIPRTRDSEPTVGYARWYMAMLQRDFSRAVAIAVAHPAEIFSSQEYYLPRDMMTGIAYARAGNRARAIPALERARRILEEAVAEVPTDHRRHLALGRVLAELGHRNEAQEAGRRGIDLLPTSRDAFQGPVLALDLAEIYGRTGQADHALAVLESLPRTGLVSGNRLRMDPRWDPLRREPRFRRLVGAR